MSKRLIKISNREVLYISDDLQVEYSHGTLRFVEYKARRTLCVVNVENSKLYSFLAHFNIIERLLRLEPRCVMRIEKNSFLVSIKNYLLKVKIPSGEIEIDHCYEDGTKNPLYFCCYNRNGKHEIVYGDYGGRDSCGKVGIYRRRDNKWSRIATFQNGLIDHIHRVEYDTFRDCYWLFTGDSDNGSGIWKLSADSGEIKPYLTGQQRYRSCVAYIMENTILYATDTPIAKNAVYEIEIKNKEMNKICDLPGPCIYGCRVRSGNDMIYCFATAVEPDSLLPKWLYRITYQLGPGIRDRYSYVIGLNGHGEYNVLHKARKDWLPIWLFQFGNHRFPEQPGDNELYMYTQGCIEKGTFKLVL